MSEEPGSEEVAFDSAAFEEWIERTAQSKGISRGEVLDQMLSSYWILEELTGMMDGAEGDGPASRLGGETTGNEPNGDRPDADASGGGPNPHEREDDRPDEGETSELIREFQQLRSAIQELPERRETGPTPPPDPRLDDRRARRVSGGRADDRLRRRFSELQDGIEDISEELSEVRSEHDRDVADLDADIEETRETLAELESSVDELLSRPEIESLVATLEQELSYVEQKATEVDGRLAQLEEAHSETAGELANVADGQTQLEARIEREFDSIENVFRHLLDETDDLEHRLGTVSDTHDEDMESVEGHIAEREHLAGLMREAQRKGISTAVCDGCETKVDLQLLGEPYCPGCDRSISGLEPGGWLPFDKPTLETEPPGTASDGLDDGPPDPSDLLESPPSDDPRT